MPYSTSLSTTFGSPRLCDLRPFKSGVIHNIAAFVSPTGQYYVTTPSGVRIDCHNAATARYYVKNGILVSVAVAAHKEAQRLDFASRRRVTA